MRSLAMLLLVLVAVGACGKKKPDLDADSDLQIIVGGDGIVAGYNEPVAFQSGVGVRAVVQTRDGVQLLVISLANRSDETVLIEPAAFRVMLPERQLYEFQPDRESLSGFPPTVLDPGETDEVSVGLGRGAPALVGLTLLFQYPPRNVFLRVPIESAS